MKIESSYENGCLRLYLSGELDHHAARKAMSLIEEKIDSSLPRDCVIDMTNLTFMDSSGIALVLKTHRLVNQVSGRLWVENVQKQPMRVLDASGIERIISISSVLKES